MYPSPYSVKERIETMIFALLLCIFVIAVVTVVKSASVKMYRRLAQKDGFKTADKQYDAINKL